MKYQSLGGQRDFNLRLEALDPALNFFCEQFGYRRATDIGRWPARRLLSAGVPSITIEFSLAAGSGAITATDFSPEALFSLDSGAWILDGDILYAISGPFIAKLVPFKELEKRLAEYLGQANTRLSRFTADFLMRYGKRTDRKLPRPRDEIATSQDLEELRRFFDVISPDF